MSLQEVARRLHSKQATIEQTLDYMEKNGCSVTLHSEDDQWRCIWMTGAGGSKLFESTQATQRLAILDVLNQVFRYYAEGNE